MVIVALRGCLRIPHNNKLNHETFTDNNADDHNPGDVMQP